MKKFLFYLAVVAIAVAGLAGCNQTDADVASRNLSVKAEMFEVDRRIVFFNGITDTYLMSIEGRCSIEPSTNVLRVTCKTGPGEFKKHYLGLSDNVSYFVEQMKDVDVSVYRYKVIFKPSTIIPDIDMPIGEQG